MVHRSFNKDWFKIPALAIAIVMLFSMGVFAENEVVEAGVKAIDIIAINDFHAEIEASNGYPIASALYNKVKEITDANPEGSLVIGGGDLYDNPPMSVELKGVPTRKILERMGMEVTSLGNHECMWGLDIINNETYKDASLEVLCANLIYKNTGDLVYKPYRIFNKGGVRIAVIGSATGAVEKVLKRNKKHADYALTDAAEAVNSIATEIKNENMADIVLVVNHEGGKVINNELTGALANLANKLSGVDALYGGHSHSAFINKVNGIYLHNSGAHGRGLIHTRITLSENGAAPEINSRHISIGDIEADVSSVPLDPEIESIIQQAKEDTRGVYSEELGIAEERITKQQMSAPYGSSEIGNWVTDKMKEKTGADAALCQNRYTNTLLKGKITPTTFFYMTFKNGLMTISLTKDQLKAALENAFRDEDEENKLAKGTGIQVSGLKIKYDMNRPSMDRIVDISRTDGSQIADEDKLLVAVHSRLVDRAEGIPELAEYDLKGLKTPMWKCLTESFREKGKIIVDRTNRVENVTEGYMPAQIIETEEEEEELEDAA